MGIYDNIALGQKDISINGNRSLNCFTLMHKDTPLLAIDDKEGEITKVYEEYKSVLPFALRGKKHIKYMDFYRWASKRALPLSRDHAKNILNACGIPQDDAYGISRACKLLTIDDCYWIREEDESWSDVNLREHALSEEIEQIALSGDYITISGEVFSPEFTTHGTYTKCWHREEDGLYLLKKSARDFESEKEVLSSDILDVLRIDHVKYEMTSIEGVCRCRCMTDEDKSRINYGEFEQYCNDIGTDALRYFLSHFKEQFLTMNLIDYLIANVDRHPGNWGIYMDNQTGEIICPHPLYDHNASFSSFVFNEGTGSMVIPGVSMKEAAREAQEKLQLDLSVLEDIPCNRFENLGIDYQYFLNRIKDVQQQPQGYIKDDFMQKALVSGYVNGYKSLASQLQRRITEGLITKDDARKALENYIHSEVPKQYREMTIEELAKEGKDG